MIFEFTNFFIFYFFSRFKVIKKNSSSLYNNRVCNFTYEISVISTKIILSYFTIIIYCIITTVIQYQKIK